MIDSLENCKKTKSIVPFFKLGACIKSIFHILMVVMIVIVISPIVVAVMVWTMCKMQHTYYPSPLLNLPNMILLILVVSILHSLYLWDVIKLLFRFLYYLCIVLYLIVLQLHSYFMWLFVKYLSLWNQVRIKLGVIFISVGVFIN